MVVVDEMQATPGVDYESMLSELGKFGASFILATQSLAKLADLSPTMQDTLPVNFTQDQGWQRAETCQVVFGISALVRRPCTRTADLPGKKTLRIDW